MGPLFGADDEINMNTQASSQWDGLSNDDQTVKSMC